MCNKVQKKKKTSDTTNIIKFRKKKISLLTNMFPPSASSCYILFD